MLVKENDTPVLGRFVLSCRSRFDEIDRTEKYFTEFVVCGLSHARPSYHDVEGVHDFT